MFTDPNALGHDAHTSAPQNAGPAAYGSSIGTSPVGYGPLGAPPGDTPAPGPSDYTLYRGSLASGPSGPVVIGAAPPSRSPNSGLKVAAAIVGVLVLICVVLITVLVAGGSKPSPTTVAVAPSQVTTVTAVTTIKTTTSVATTAPTTRITLPPTTTNPRMIGNDLGPGRASDIDAIDQVYKAILRSDWDYTGSHFINAKNEGPNQSTQWWSSQYGTIKDYWLAPVRVNGNTIVMGLVTHEADSSGQFSNQFCIPFTVTTNAYVRQTGAASRANKTPGVWIDPQQGVAPLMSC